MWNTFSIESLFQGMLYFHVLKGSVNVQSVHCRPFRRLDGNGDLRWEKISSLDKGHIYKQVSALTLWVNKQCGCYFHRVRWRAQMWHFLINHRPTDMCVFVLCRRETCLTFSGWRAGEGRRFFTLETIFIATWLWVSKPDGHLELTSCPLLASYLLTSRSTFWFSTIFAKVHLSYLENHRQTKLSQT